MTLNLEHGAPRAAELARFAGTIAAERGLDAATWDIDGASLRPAPQMGKELTGLTALYRMWMPLYERTPRVAPAEVFLEQLQQGWARWSLERRFFEAAITTANGLPWKVLLSQEEKNLRREMASATDADRRVTEVLLHAVRDLQEVHANRGGVVVNPDNVQQFFWTGQNLEVFLRAHWALHKTVRDIVEFSKKRMRAFREAEGVVEGPENLSATHDETD